VRSGGAGDHQWLRPFFLSSGNERISWSRDSQQGRNGEGGYPQRRPKMPSLKVLTETRGARKTSPSVHALIASHARFHASELFWCRLALVLRFPLRHRHAVNQFPRGILVALETGVANPVRQTIPAEAREPHQVDILCVGAVAQVPH